MRHQPCLIVAGNCMSVSTGPIHARNIFRAYLNTPDAVVILLSECADFDGQRVADEHQPGVWAIYQPGTIGSPESGCLIARRRDRTHSDFFTLTLGTRATSEGGGIRNRYIASADIIIDPGTEGAWRHAFSAAHAPPPRAPRARFRFMRKFAKIRGGIRGGDMNLPARAVARIFTSSKVHAAGVLCIAVPGWMPTGPTRTIPKRKLAGADHDGVAVLLFPKVNR